MPKLTLTSKTIDFDYITDHGGTIKLFFNEVSQCSIRFNPLLCAESFKLLAIMALYNFLSILALFVFWLSLLNLAPSSIYSISLGRFKRCFTCPSCFQSVL